MASAQAKDSPRIVIVGGVAGGASAAARCRRLCENASITIFERGPYISFANCGLPYYVGSVIKTKEDLLVASVGLFRNRLNVDVRLRQEVTKIDRQKKTVDVTDLENKRSYQEKYDYLVLAPGAEPIRPKLEGIDLEGVYSIRDIPDASHIKEWISKNNAKSAVVVGGGFIGLEMAENLCLLNLKVHLVEALPQLMPAMDPEMLPPLYRKMKEHGVDIIFHDGLKSIKKEESSSGKSSLRVITASGNFVVADMVILGIGVRPDAHLAKDCGLKIGSLGGIVVDEHMKTSDDNIYAVGDAVEVDDFLFPGEKTLLALAGPANRQARIAVESILGRKNHTFRGVQGTFVCGAFGMVVAATGASEKKLQKRGWKQGCEYETAVIHAGSHAGYYPNSKTIHLKLIFGLKDGKILGAQAVGEDGVDKRIDCIAMAIQAGMTVMDIEESELCYAPQFGSAKDPVNLAGMVASNILRGDVQQTHWLEHEEWLNDSMTKKGENEKNILIDVRNPEEVQAEPVPHAQNIPLRDIRSHLEKLPKEKEIAVFCRSGQRSYLASRILCQLGYHVKNISGGFLSYRDAKASSDISG
ncbi:Coenzyme A disulfide reductase [Galdieria sulphuraria]|uniref:Pyridine nucleotide-disulfide oxidoreductase n=1 Tax=Galdieria sulphuraria TaxID=130081 RepID=M2X6I5_GALSU|nr:pyridine nucleotide-disulfide oxidoreductase [Galdieria sulphuraria]EME32130.1 pyridine nucleotide-disulfide oxidoreductase [Galdieria sulphuraria]GJD09555.1 Coenzyme A disulfide reductase [Galdieria sulphuraria]|eukprot:XP_005708650.1 pyridine nucleotide-disulfide oxidoreductase [Galdieria sulphuraria]